MAVDPFEESYRQRRAQVTYSHSLLRDFSSSVKVLHPIINGRAKMMVMRPLTEPEIATLTVQCHCKCRREDWSSVRVMYSPSSSSTSKTTDLSYWMKRQVQHTSFAGKIILGIDTRSNDDDDESSVGCVKWNDLVENCVLEPNCRVYQNDSVSNTHVCAGAELSNCGTLSWTEEQPSSGNNTMEMKITMGPETGGGRTVSVTPESTLISICHDLGMSRHQPPPPLFLSMEMNVLEPHSKIQHTPTLSNIYVSSHSSILAATSVSNVVLLPHATIAHSASCNYVYLQWNANVTAHSHVSHSLLMEEAHVGPHSVVSNSVLATDCHVSCGEVHSSLLGPNTNAHHQSLLISVLWPLGRGNVGYGANMGSNHTGRLPDQELSCGEGIFWGLNCSLKYPLNVLGLVYGIVASGVELSPESSITCMPFSLVLPPPIHNGPNEIVPGWVLWNSPYTMARSELKLATRRKATRHAYTGWKMIRPAIIDMCVIARASILCATTTIGETRIRKNKTNSLDKVYTWKVEGIGSNRMTEKGRSIGIRAYTDLIQRYALTGLLDRIQKQKPDFNVIASTILNALGKKDTAAVLKVNDIVINSKANNVLPSWPILPWEELSYDNNDALWEHQFSILIMELPSLIPLEDDTTFLNTNEIMERLLRTLMKLEQEFAHRVYRCKKRDDERGTRIIPAYDACHVRANDDPVVSFVRENTKRVKSAVETMIVQTCKGKEEHCRL